MGRVPVAACLLVLIHATAAGALLEPIVVDQEQIFEISWQIGEFEGRPQLSGRIDNKSFYWTGHIQLLVDRLDEAGRVVHQQLAWLGTVLLPGERSYFDIPVADRTARYRVRVYAFTRGLGVPK